MNASNGVYFGLHDLNTPCVTAEVSLSVDPQGNVFPCTYHREVDPKSDIGKDRIVLG